jgi:purine-binding chemotaxis protein CheW
MDVRLRFKKPPKDYTDRTCVIVTDFGGISAGLIVDSVSEVMTISRERILRKKPEITSNCGQGYVDGIGKIGGQIVMLLDCAKLLTEKISTSSRQMYKEKYIKNGVKERK